MSAKLAIPIETRQLLEKVNFSDRHPGLQLDKYSIPGKQEEQKKALDDVCACPVSADVLTQQLERRKTLLDNLDKQGLHVRQWKCITDGPVTLHLARPNALENSGICLHPVYGFVYFPSTGLKGMARAYAETVWLPAHGNGEAERKKIIKVFGNKPGEKDEKEQTSGSVVFHDAWPRAWPKLYVDIVNNHHPEYYGANPNDKGHAPGDWENPNPVYFLAIGPNNTFSFAVSKRRSDVDNKLIELAREWLTGALCYKGAGAKTAAGYGAFVLKNNPAEVEKKLAKEVKETWESWIGNKKAYRFCAQLRIISPAFLGGAEAKDLDPAQPLRSASVKGLLRFWWRSMHGDWDINKLREEEGCIFGDTKQGQGLQVRVETKQKREQPIGADPGGSALGYTGYGPIEYDPNQHGNRSKRKALDVGSAFEVTLLHKDKAALNEAVKALWLFGALGGIGSRSRRGWGSVSIAPVDGFNWPDNLPCLNMAKNVAEFERLLDEGLKIVSPVPNRPSATATPCQVKWTALSKEYEKIVGSIRNDWKQALQDVSSKFQSLRSWYGKNRNGAGGPGPDYHFTKAILAPSGYTSPLPPARLPERAAFGLPYAQEYKSLRDLNDRTKPCRLEYIAVPKKAKADAEGRRASPIIIKLLSLADNKIVWIVSFFPGQFVPDDYVVRIKKTSIWKENGRKRSDSSPIILTSPVSFPGHLGIPGGQSGTVPQAKSEVDPKSTLVLDFLLELQGTNTRKARPTSPPPTSGSHSSHGGHATTLTAPIRIQQANKPVGKGQTLIGILHRNGSIWAASFAGDPRGAVISNPNKIPNDLSDGAHAEFFVQEASKKGIRVRFEKLSK